MNKILIGLASILLSSCMGMPKDVVPIENFNVNNYLGKWYEIARLDHSFERGLHNVSATYTLREDGGVKVLNRGYSIADKGWKTAEGKAYLVKNDNIGHLKVSFFGPFYSSYVIFELDEKEENYAFVSGYNNSYLWLLSRTPTISEDVSSRFIEKAARLGFDTDNLIFVEHDKQ